MTRKNLGAHPEFLPGEGRELTLKDIFKDATNKTKFACLLLSSESSLFHKLVAIINSKHVSALGQVIHICDLI